MSFSFGFSGDDIEEDPNNATTTAQNDLATTQDAPAPIPARTHALDELVGKLDSTAKASPVWDLD